jgi:molecular chaperone GrpE
VLADFRDWLTDAPVVAAPTGPAAETVDLHRLLGQFTALRQEVNLQTKASRATLEQNSEMLRQLEDAINELREPPAEELVEEEAEEDEEEEHASESKEVQPLLKSIIDVYDALALAQRQVEKQKLSILDGLTSIADAVAVEPPPYVPEPEENPGFWAKLFGSEPAPEKKSPLADWHRQITKKLKDKEQDTRKTCDFLRDVLDGLMTGYAMSMNRIDRVLAKYGLDVMKCVGQRFDPEAMEVVGATPNSGRPLGEVLEEIRRGYLINGAIYRYAQVRVAR